MCVLEILIGTLSFHISFFLPIELSEVLWNMVFKMAFKMSGVIGFVAVFALFASWAGMLFSPYFCFIIHNVIHASLVIYCLSGLKWLVVSSTIGRNFVIYCSSNAA